MGKMQLEITDAIGEKVILDVTMNHPLNSGVSMTLLFDKGLGGHYVLSSDNIRNLMHLMVEQVS